MKSPTKSDFSLSTHKQLAHQFGQFRNRKTRIRWGSATKVLPFRPKTLGDAQEHILEMMTDPVAGDVMIAEIMSVGRHSGLELDTGRKTAFDVGDLVAATFGNRYATAQFFGHVPKLRNNYHMLSQAAVCGEVVSAPSGFGSPTILKPLGYFTDEQGQIVNTRNHGLAQLPMAARHSQVILVVGSSMDAGKTTAAASTIRGLTRSGLSVNAGKVTGTSCAKDLMKMYDAGADRTLDFSDVGFPSTALVEGDELLNILHVLISNLSDDSPDYIVLEIADGVIQRETRQLMTMMNENSLFDFLILSVHDAMAAPACINLIQSELAITPTFVTGPATRSPLSKSELEALVKCPCLTREQLQSPEVRHVFGDELDSPRRIEFIRSNQSVVNT